MKTTLVVFSCLHCFSIILLTQAGAPEVGDMEDVFQSLAQWMAGRGASVEKALKGGYKEHGGANIRSVISTGNFTKGTLFMRMPKQLWIWEHTKDFADLMVAKQMHSPAIEACRSLDPKVLTNLVVAIGLAREKAKGETSDLRLALKSFPKAHDFESFHPRFAGPEILEDFKALKFCDTIRQQQVMDKALQQCFIGFQQQSSIQSLVGIEWSDVQEAAMQVRTRAYGNAELLPNSSVVIPLADLLNTAPSAKWNTRWSLSADSFQMIATQGIGADVELVESYCPLCDNRRMLSLWGIYLENNGNRGLSCSLEQASDRVLQNATMAVLEVKKAPKLTAPRCKASVFAAKQGALRCSLARLTWEACSPQWAGNNTSQLPGNFVLLSDLKQVFRRHPRHSRRRRSKVMSLSSGKLPLHAEPGRNSALLQAHRALDGHANSLHTAAWEAALLDQSCRHQVHPDLLRGSSQV
jgi:hypothetical protein